MLIEGIDGGISIKKFILSIINLGVVGIVIRMLYYIIVFWNNNDILNNGICLN